MDVTELGMLIVVRLVQSEKANSPIVVTELGMLIVVRLVQPEKALFPIVVTEFPMLKSVRLQYIKEYSPMDVTVLPIITDFRLE